MESFSDKARAFGLAFALHAGFVLALLIGLWWTHQARPVVMPGPVIEATLVGPTAAPKPRSGTRQAAQPKPEPKPQPKAEPKPEPEPQPRPEPKPEPAKETPTEVQRQDLVEREKVAALAREQAEQAKREEEARVRQQQVLLEQEEKQKKLREEQQKQLAEIRKQREAAEKKLNLEKERLAQIEDRNKQAAAREASAAETEHQAERAQTGAGGADNDLAARYAAAIQAAVTQNWNRPESASAGLRCSLNITQIPGGDVLSATVGSPCNADAATRLSIEQAVMKAAPLPYQGYEKVFQRSIKFNFKYDGQD
ncbi:MAG: cell envelope integrity protein TolA [Xanthomonadales bacterium]|nr:cell envelope integrity protein TolA [Xanthomonadales bacterium]